MEFVDLNEFPLDPDAARLIPEALARRHRVLAIGYRGDTPIIGMANPSDVFAVDDLRTLLGSDLHIVVCSAGQIAEYLSRVYRHDQETTLAAQSSGVADFGRRRDQDHGSSPTCTRWSRTRRSSSTST